MMNIYYMTIKMSGEMIDPDSEADNMTKVVITIPYLNYKS